MFVAYKRLNKVFVASSESSSKVILHLPPYGQMWVKVDTSSNNSVLWEKRRESEREREMIRAAREYNLRTRVFFYKNIFLYSAGYIKN